MLVFLAIVTTIVLGFVYLKSFLRSLKVGDYASKYVFITGCDSGFGKKLTIHLDKMGFHVISGCLTQEGANDLTHLCSERHSTVILNVTDLDSIEKAYTEVKNSLPSGKGLWAVVNNAGVSGNPSHIEMCSKQDFVDTLEVNLYGPIQITKTFLPLIRQSRGRVVCITSVMGRYPACPAPYAVSKFGFEAYCDVLRREVYRQGIKVSILEPGYFKTEILNFDGIKNKIQTSYDSSSPEVKRVYGSEHPQKMTAILTEIVDKASTDINQVIQAFDHAITAKFPKTRYVVGLDAKCLYVPLSFLPDWLGDWVMNAGMKFATRNIKYA